MRQPFLILFAPFPPQRASAYFVVKTSWLFSPLSGLIHPRGEPVGVYFCALRLGGLANPFRIIFAPFAYFVVKTSWLLPSPSVWPDSPTGRARGGLFLRFASRRLGQPFPILFAPFAYFVVKTSWLLLSPSVWPDSPTGRARGGLFLRFASRQARDSLVKTSWLFSPLSNLISPTSPWGSIFALCGGIPPRDEPVGGWGGGRVKKGVGMTCQEGAVCTIFLIRRMVGNQSVPSVC